MTVDLVPLLFAALSIFVFTVIFLFFILIQEKKRVKSLEEKEESLLDTVNHLSVGSAELKERLTAEKSSNLQLQDDNAYLNQRLNKAKSEFLRQRTEIENLKDTIGNLKDTIEDLEQQLSNFDNLTNSLRRLLAIEKERNSQLAQMEITQEFLIARSAVYDMDVPFVFISGGAGTGKSQFLKYVLDSKDPSIAMVSPTGLAAKNIGGRTIHSCFSFPQAPYATPNSLPDHKYQQESYNFLRKINILVIDEISMVRSDMLDLLSLALKTARGDERAFGGVKIVVVGDLYQLPPIVSTKEFPDLNAMFSASIPAEFKCWKTRWFFDALTMTNMPIQYIEFTKQFRQKGDQYEYAAALNRIRLGCDQETLNYFNQRVCPAPDNIPHIFPCIKMVREHNQKMLSRLPGDTFTYEGKCTGTFSQYEENDLPVPSRLELKVGALVMFVQNNEYWRNGSMGIVRRMDKDCVEVQCDDDGVLRSVSATEWEDNQFDKDGNLIVVGTYTQIPLVHAWAFTVHKTQGLTFDTLAFDPKRIFDDGMAYVALSRTKSIDGLFLLSPLLPEHIRQHPDVKKFYSNFSPQETYCSPVSLLPVPQPLPSSVP